ncbi:hypothetical protein HDU93_008275 [Gonapodya sp. JEL0774]|nr:hypothetical protein HDU93_008275 [Gonapodya sp. JEL0774]
MELFSRDHLATSLPPFPASQPSDLPLVPSVDPCPFDPTLHLDVVPPEYVVDLHFKRWRLDELPEDPNKWPGLAFTAPFKLLSDAGVDAIREILRRSRDAAPPVSRSSDMIPESYRGLAYVSPFIRDYNRSPVVLDLLSKFAVDPGLTHRVHIFFDKVVPDSLPLNYSHTNVGKTGPAKNVVGWHFDSVQYVTVVILSDSTGMQGGALRVLAKPVEEATSLILAEKAGSRPPLGEEDGVMEVEYPGKGWCILMQGGLFWHQVTPVLSAPESRITCVNSYQSRRIFSGKTAFDGRDDFTRYQYFGAIDEPHVAPLEYAIHKSWRVQNILGMLSDGTVPFSEDKSKILSVLDRAIAELQECRDSLETVVPYTQAVDKSNQAKYDYTSALRAKGIASALDELENCVAAGEGTAAGWVAYEAAPAFDPRLEVRPAGEVPLLWFGLFTKRERIALPSPEGAFSSDSNLSRADWVKEVSPRQYEDSIRRVLDYIREGETYQVNFTFRQRTEFNAEPWNLFLRLVAAQEKTYGAYVDTGRFVVCSASPELFFTLEGDRIVSLPMKGTAARGLTLAQDREQARELLASEKERAENLMITDMVWNSAADWSSY